MTTTTMMRRALAFAVLPLLCACPDDQPNKAVVVEPSPTVTPQVVVPPSAASAHPSTLPLPAPSVDQ